MSSNRPNNPYPWPYGLWTLCIALLACSGLALLYGLLGEPSLWVPVATLLIGIALIMLCVAVIIVNRDHYPEHGFFLLPSRAGPIETRSIIIAAVYIAAFGLIGLLITAVSLSILLAT